MCQGYDDGENKDTYGKVPPPVSFGFVGQIKEDWHNEDKVNVTGGTNKGNYIRDTSEVVSNGAENEHRNTATGIVSKDVKCYSYCPSSNSEPTTRFSILGLEM